MTLPQLAAELDQAEREAWAALGRYKFWMFGYFATRWVFLNRIGSFKRPNPFKPLVHLARRALASSTSPLAGEDSKARIGEAEPPAALGEGCS